MKDFQEGLKKQKPSSASLEPWTWLSFPFFHPDSLAAPRGGKLDSRLIDFCFHNFKKPFHREALWLISWASEDDVLALEELVSESEPLGLSSRLAGGR